LKGFGNCSGRPPVKNSLKDPPASLLELPDPLFLSAMK